MAFEPPIDAWERAKNILIWAILIVGYVDLVLLGFYLGERI